jgi:hypothetical protein
MGFLKKLKKLKPLKIAASVVKKVVPGSGVIIDRVDAAIKQAKASGQPVIPAMTDAAQGGVREVAVNDFWQRAGPKVAIAAGVLLMLVVFTRKG